MHDYALLAEEGAFLYLKSIEIQGFKSFPDKTVMQFGRGVTAIVGPNGSGKSNIVDAIRWVLGEQSTKTLRGGKMEDVIFGGTARRNPLGFCQVTLVMDNSDGGLPIEYGEVMVTRRYYRSGQSDFFINRKAVRLKDIHELFMDTGLGRDGYSVIGQGRIDEILSVKSADRREIFEEAAGITKFRYRKEESERKLDACEENLVRIRDIITELETQVGPLKEQAEKAQSFLIYRDELRVLEVNVWLDSLEKLKDSLHKAQTDYLNAERMLSARKREAEELQEQSNALTEELHQQDAAGEQVREELREAENREADIRAQMAVGETHIRNNEDNIRQKKQEMTQQQDQGDSLEEQKRAKERRLEELKANTAQLEAQMEELLRQVQQAAESARDLGDKLAALEAQAQLHQDSANQDRAQMTALDSGAQEILARGKTVESDLAELEGRLEEEKAKARQLRRDIEENEDKKSSAENMLRGFALRGEARKKKVEELRQKLEQASRQSEIKGQRLDMLRAMEREYEGFGQSVRRVMQAAARRELNGIHGPVSTLIRTQDKYSVAIEIALGAAMQNIVTDDEQSAKTAIGYLKSHDFGRATFLPMTAVKERRSDWKLKGDQSGFQGWADGLVEYDSRYDRVIRSLLAGTAVVDHIDSAIRMAKNNGYGFRIVTLDGQLINPSGAMTGGSLNKNTGMLSRKNEIERLEAELKTLSGQIEESQQALKTATQELDSVTYEAQVAQEELRRAQDALLESTAYQTQHAALLDTLRSRVGELEEERDSQDARIAKINNQKNELLAHAQQEEAQAAKLRQEADTLSGGRAAEESRTSLLTQQVTDLRVALAESRTESESTVTGISELEALIASSQGELRSKEEIIAALETRNQELRKTIADQEQVAQQYAAEAAAKQARLQAINQEKLRLEGARQKCDRDYRQKSDELINLERERGRLENKKTQAEMEEDNILQKLWESYELTRVTAQELKQELESLPKANRRIAELRASIKKLGPVNVNSIEEYAKVSERYEFMDAQRNDLESAKADLLKIIGDLTRNMKDIFGTEFRKINETFQQTFVEIFGGGSAYLKLEDESDLLNCGIEIKVELPGKSMRAISLLSGGEKAFVAIALYFAIIKVRPTPFCVLDEIDAALDDVNVSRYASYMRTLCEQTQFIIITHRRGTMEGADILYGVTMQEQGVTKLLALHINEVEEHIKEKIQ
ncbi:MAG: chromosome segregation protein SMC [Clostridia bacterium]|nr:chromosome segregation protein SMC [Clostridia bacterium]